MGSGGEDRPANLAPKPKPKKKQKNVDYHKITQKNLTEEQKFEQIRMIHDKHVDKLSTSSGISGIVFKTKELYFSNNASKETKFQEEVDNQTASTDVKNFMIAPIFTSEKPTAPMNPHVPCAVLQFINKLDPEDRTKVAPIDEKDIAKFKSMQKLLGMCVENTNELRDTIKISFEFKDTMKKIH